MRVNGPQQTPCAHCARSTNAKPNALDRKTGEPVSLCENCARYLRADSRPAVSLFQPLPEGSQR